MTIVELMIALIIISISILAVYQMFVTGTALITEQYYRRYALDRAQAWMERMKYYESELDTVPRSFRRSFVDTLVPESEDRVAIPAECRIDVEHSFERDPETGLPFYSDVMVSYNWEAPSGRTYSIELRSSF